MTKITILGNGAIGMHQAFAFALAGNEVTILGRPNSTKIPILQNNDDKNIILSCPDIDEIKTKLQSQETVTAAELLTEFNELPHFQRRLKGLLGKQGFRETEALTNEQIEQLMEQLTTIKAVTEFDKTNSADLQIRVLCDEHDVAPDQELIVTTVKVDALNKDNAERLNVIRENSSHDVRVVVAANGMMPWVEQKPDFDYPDILENVNEFANTIGREHVIGMVLSYAASITGGLENPGFVRLASRYNHTSVPIGDAVKRDTKSLEEVANMYNSASMNCTAETEGVAFKMLTKLGINMANPVTAIFGTTYQQAMDQPLINELIMQCTSELFDIITHPSLNLYNYNQLIDEHDYSSKPLTPLELAKEKFMAHTTEFMRNNNEHRTSTLVDIDNFQSTEAAYIIDVVVEMAKSHNIDAPVLSKVSEMLAAVERCATSADNAPGRVNHFREQLTQHLDLNSTQMDGFLNIDINHFTQYQEEERLPDPTELTAGGSMNLGNGLGNSP